MGRQPSRILKLQTSNQELNRLQDHLSQQLAPITQNTLFSMANFRWNEGPYPTASDPIRLLLQHRTSGDTWATIAYIDSSGNLSTVTNVASNTNALTSSLLTAKGSLITATAASTPAEQKIGTNGQVLQADSTQADGMKWAGQGFAGAVGPYAMDPTQTAWMGYHCNTIAGSTASFVGVGSSAQTPNGATALVAVPGVGKAIQFAGGAGVGAVSGITRTGGANDNFLFNTANRGPRLVMHTTLIGSAAKFWIAITAGTLNGHVPPVAGASAAFATQYIGCYFDPAVNSGKWLVCSGDGTNESSIDSGITGPSTNTTNVDFVYYRMGTEFLCGFSDGTALASFPYNSAYTYISKTRNLPVGAGVTAAEECFIVSKDTSAPFLRIGPYAYSA